MDDGNRFFSLQTPGLRCHYSYDPVPDRGLFAMHTHDRYELYLFLNGRGTFCVEGTRYPLSEGDILVMRPAEAHYMDIDPRVPYERAAFHFGADFFREDALNRSLLLPFHDRDAGAYNRYGRAELSPAVRDCLIPALLAEGDDAVRLLRIRAYLPALLCELCAACLRRRAVSADSETEAQRIVRYISGHIADDLTLDAVCRRFYISKSRLCRLFRSATGSTVGQYVRAKRMLLARRLLAEGASPTRAAAACGYRDYSAFYRAFVKRYGQAPREDRARAEGRWPDP